MKIQRTIKIDPKLDELIKLEAKEENRSINGEIEYIIKKYFEMKKNFTKF